MTRAFNLKFDAGKVAIASQGEQTFGEMKFSRVVSLLSQIDLEELRKAEAVCRVIPGTVKFMEQMLYRVGEVRAGRLALDGDTFLQVHLDRLEDAFVWSKGGPILEGERRKMVIGFLRRDGLDELADQIEKVEVEMTKQENSNV